MSPRVVLFDLDGTLVDSLPGITNAVNATLGTAMTPQELRAGVGPPLHETFARLTGASGAELEALVEDYRARYAQTMVADTAAYDGVAELLAALTERGDVLAVATSKAKRLAQELLDGLGLAGSFAAVEGPVPPARDSKADTIAAALRALDARASDVSAMVGDRVHDVDGAHAHGIRAIGALWGFGDADELAAADALAPTPADVASLLG